MGERVAIEVLDDGVLTIEEQVPQVIEVSMPGPRGAPGPGVPTGGATNEVLRKRSAFDYDVEWGPPSAGGGFAYNVMDFTARLDTIDRDDGAMTSGQPLLSIPVDTEVPFTNADIGKSVPGVEGAGLAGDDLRRATIIDVISPTVVVLSKNAQTTVANARFQYGTDDTDAIQATADTARGNGRQLIYQPAGIAIYTGKRRDGQGAIAHVDVGQPPFGYVGDGSDLSIILQGDDWDDPLFSYQSRHGTPNNSFADGGSHRDYSTKNPGRRFRGDIFELWQVIGFQTARVYYEEVDGRIMTLNWCEYPDVDVSWKDCGNGTNGNPTIFWNWSKEGGFLQGRTIGGRLRAQGVGNFDIGILLQGTENCRLDVDIEGSGPTRSVIYVIDGISCQIYGNVRAGDDDCVHLQSQGDSAYNIVDVIASGARGATPGTGWGINEQKGPGMIHTGNRLSGVFHDNAAGGISP
jgi:hypothetical protein